MNVVISINGREAIPVRAIAWATSSILSPDVLAEDLAKHSESPDHHPPRLNNAMAYHLIGNSEVRAMAPREWDYVVRGLSALHKDLKDANLTRSEDRRQWELRATETMPRGTFLWKDEFEAAYQRGYRTRQIREEREGDRGYTCNPIVPEYLEPIILEGFERFIRGQPSTEPQQEPQPVPAREQTPPPVAEPGAGVPVTLPHMTPTLEALFAVMWENWGTYDPSRRPKQVNIAHELDRRLDLSPGADGSPSRTSKVLAKAINPTDRDP